MTTAITPGARLRGAQVDRRDPALGDGRADDVAVGGVRRGIVPLVGVAARCRVVLSGPSMRSSGRPTTFSWSIGLVVAGVSNFMGQVPILLV